VAPRALCHHLIVAESPGVAPLPFASDELVSRLLAQQSVLAWISDWAAVETALRARGITSSTALGDALQEQPDGLFNQVPLPTVVAASPGALAIFGAGEVAELNALLGASIDDGQRVATLNAFLGGAASPQHHLALRATIGIRQVLYDWLYAPRFGVSAYAFAVGFEITAGARALADLAMSEERYRHVVEDQTELIVRYGPGGVRTFVNDAYCRYFGAPRHTLVGTSFFDLIAPEHRERVEEKLRAITAHDPVQVEEHRVLTRDGAVHWQEWVDRGIFDANGALVEYQAVGRDVTERVLARKQLRAALDEVERLRDRLAAENLYLRERVRTLEGTGELLGDSASMRQLRAEIGRVAPTDATVLVRGETGVGKELVANALHAQSKRAERALIKINCAAIAAELTESELFGHVRGAFTSATSDRDGSFAAADGGTLFLDEIGELPLATQAKLLRALQDGEIQPVGSSKTRHVDVRILAATNRNLEDAVTTGTFRRDLYYRVAVFPIDVPALRDRGDDVVALAEAFVRRAAERYASPARDLTDDAKKRLLAHDWPGNVRELSNVIERAVIGSKTAHIAAGDLSIVTMVRSSGPPRSSTHTLDDAMRDYIVQVLESTRWQVGGPKGAAALLGLNESTLRARMRKLGIERPR
jgi:PAS domain S-box-containing protein